MPDPSQEPPRRRATALRYEQGRSAPEVVATGAGLIADRILAAAREAGVPVRHDPRPGRGARRPGPRPGGAARALDRGGGDPRLGLPARRDRRRAPPPRIACQEGAYLAEAPVCRRPWRHKRLHDAYAAKARSRRGLCCVLHRARRSGTRAAIARVEFIGLASLGVRGTGPPGLHARRGDRDQAARHGCRAQPRSQRRPARRPCLAVEACRATSDERRRTRPMNRACRPTTLKSAHRPADHPGSLSPRKVPSYGSSPDRQTHDRRRRR